MIVRVPGSSPYEPRYGYCRLVIAGEWALTAGTTASGLVEVEIEAYAGPGRKGP